MNFDFDPATQEMYDAVALFSRKKLCATTTGFDSDEFRSRWQLAGHQGLVGSTVPTEYGGGGLDAVTAAALMEALGEGCTDTGFAFSVAAHLFACLMPISAFGTEDQKKRWLPGLSSGEHIAAHGITEPDAGSDALNLRTRARRVGDHYVLNGDKCFITNSPVADVFVVQAVTEPGAGFFGLTSFIVEAGTPGLTVGRPYDKVGLRGSPTADVHLEDCAVPADQVLGAEGTGAGVFSSSMNWERTCLFAAYLGAMRRVLDSTIRYVREREQFTVPIGSFQAVSHRIVDMTLRLESARLLLYKAASGLARGSEDETPPALAKLAVSEAAVQLGLDAVQLRGAVGVLDGEAETFLRDALPSRIFSGSNEIQKNNIARAMGLSRPIRRH
ncbi:acyl-CoA dehydrogenase [Streptomyces sp. SID13666]|uniref:L-prolyl-[peptidyl-carrier protein] dehydrogenase n=1 Tax=unclassified Streptomyces TaxID=2593676 RepID=UPI001106B9E2|nr:MULTISPECIES: L-prolyl-[peptidyl-carrier protein] dehydrogenase [unclassified Streptomyces]NEA57178.1 acyl-CoA dehydrogenase [Streptomyces sp. SID13666]NEA74272.1 acyl-CoA dehydrogenase [Streptomyces sp. SID13588]QNA71968.1 acyl-CoA dehydrogenase [Streptomyces sp. So13.3]